MSRINTNVSSLVAQNTLNRSNADLQQALRRLSTGLKINTGKDDPAGLIASENLRRDITAIDKAISNSERASQVIATADSALGQVSKLLNDVRGLVTEAANRGALSDEQIAANQLQVDSSLEAIDRIAQTTAFQGRKLLDGSLDFIFSEGTGYSSVAGLQINKANLGAAGSMEVNVDITAAASKALITNAIPSSAAGQFTLGTQTFTINTTAASNLNSVTVALAKHAGPEAFGSFTVDGHKFNVTAASGQSIDNVLVDITRDSTSHFATGTLALDQSTLTLQADPNSNINNVTVAVAKSAMGATADSDNIVVTDGAGGGGTLTIAATSNGVAGGESTVNIVFQAGGTAGANYTTANQTLTITVDNGGNSSGAVIANLIETATVNGGAAGTPVFTASAGGGFVDIDGTQGAAVDLDVSSDTTLSLETATAAYSAGANTLTITLNSDLTNVTTTSILAAVNNLTEFSGSTASGPTNVATANVSADAAAATLTRAGVIADFGVTTANTLTLNFDNTQSAIDINDVISAIDGLVQFAGTTSTSDSGTINGTTAIDANDTATLTRITNGVKASFDTSSNVLTLTFDNTDTSITAAHVIAEIDGLSQFENTTATGSGTIDASTLSANPSLATAARVQDVVMRIGGEWGTEVFSFQAGTTFEQIAAAIQSVSDATGVTAEVVGSELKLGSVNYGSKAFVDVEVIREGTGGTFKANLSDKRATGADVQASVNGVVAKGDGNTLSVNTATLDMALTVADGSTTDVAFTINGGGALFQLGPTVVSNQQARLSIDSIATGQLGGATGRLYELRSGNARALASDATGAARIVDEAINSVVGLRGRLGAFQRTSLDTNIASLQDTMVNLTSAESAIRDADFAKESAAMTRAQILVQSGTAVLSIANQNPQQVLALLR